MGQTLLVQKWLCNTRMLDRYGYYYKNIVNVTHFIILLWLSGRASDFIMIDSFIVV